SRIPRPFRARRLGAGRGGNQAGSNISPAHKSGTTSGCDSHGNRSAKTGSRSDNHVAAELYRAKNGLPTKPGARAWIMCMTKTRCPASMVMPSTHTLPGVADMDGPRTVLASPETHR